MGICFIVIYHLQARGDESRIDKYDSHFHFNQFLTSFWSIVVEKNEIEVNILTWSCYFFFIFFYLFFFYNNQDAPVIVCMELFDIHERSNESISLTLLQK